jgi:hypothetical protein
MSEWPHRLARPADLSREEHFGAWFDRIADLLLNETRLVAGGERHRLVEIEFYYHGPDHADPFAHKDPVQLHCGRWYYHRTRGEYRGGSFKGLDLSFGTGGAHGGVLLRGLEAADGTLVDGPSLLVDRLLAKTGRPDVASLDGAIADRLAWDNDVPVSLERLPANEGRKVYRSARVGLSLKRSRPGSPAVRFLLRPYRYLTEPRRTAKGRQLLVLALHLGGMSDLDIVDLTGCTPSSLKRYLADLEAGRADTELKPYFGAELKPVDLSKLHGILWERP